MIMLRRMKQGLVTLVLISVLTLTFTYFLVTGRFQQPLNTNREKLSVLIKHLANQSRNISGALGDTFPFEIAMKSLEKSPKISKCGYDKCPKTKKNQINIHLIPHSHDDPGYQKTIDEYYHGTGNVNNFSVSRILDNVIHQLTLNEDRKFIYVEVVFFSMWWNLQTDPTRDTVRDLVQNGRLEFVNGGWCVNDEASPNYVDIIDQMSLGLSFLAKTFGECGRPKVAFQGDTFGHSREQALLSSLMGFDALFMGRLDEEDKNRRKNELEMEMIWFGSDLPGDHPTIFAGITYNTFDPPLGFCFDSRCGNRVPNLPINDDINSKDYNAEERINAFLDYCTAQAKTYKTNNIAVYMGSDFTYENAEVWFVNMDKLIKYINQRQVNGSRYNIFYSTPACYAKAVNEANVSWPTKKDDFLPYHGFLPAYWSGHFSSRPSLKYMIRKGSGLLQSCKQMASLLKLRGAENQGNLAVMKEAMAVLQHHDAITGTHSQRVSDDYVRILHKGVEECTKTINSYYQTELPKNEMAKEFPFSVSYCSQLNVSQCEVIDQDKNFVVNVYNALGKYINKYIRLPVIHEYEFVFYNFQVLDSDGKVIPSDFMPIASFVEKIPGRKSTTHHELIFLARNVPPLGSVSYYIEVSVSRRISRPLIPVTIWNSSNPFNSTMDLKISNEKLSLSLSNETGWITSVTFGGNTILLDQQFLWYNGNGVKCNFTEKSASGVYIFNPLNDSAVPINIKTETVAIYKGELVEEIHQTVNEYVGQIIRLYKQQDYIEFDWVIGPVPIEDGIGKEIITRYTTHLENNGTFHTDSNGRQSILRTRGKRLTYNVTVNDPTASNFYPITSHIYLTDSKSGLRMYVLTDRAQGGGSINDGQLEFLIHRRLVQDDLCFFKEPLDEMAHDEGLVVRGTHTLFFEYTKEDQYNKTDGSSTLRSTVQEQALQPEISFFIANFTANQWSRLYRSEMQFLSQSLPENVKLLTFEPRSGNESMYLLRIEHIYDVGEHVVLSKPAEVSLKGLFNGFNIEDIEETTLDGNVIKSDLVNLIWKSKNEDVNINSYYRPSYFTSLDHIKLKPMEIRTFIIRLLTKK